MGEDKSLLPFGNSQTLIEFQYNKLSKIFKNVYISSKTNKFNFSNITNNSNIILDNNSNLSSPMVALQSIFEKLSNEKIFIITVDVPLVEKDTIETLIKNCNNFDVTIAVDDDRRHNLCGVFNKSIIKQIDKLILNDIHKINYLIKQTENYKEIYFENKEQFINLNTNTDYNNALKISNSYIKY